MAEWYYIESGQTRGPVDDEAIRVLASVGRLNAASQLMQSGSSQWSTLGAFEAQLGLQRSATGGYGATGAPPPPPPPPPAGRAPSSGVWRTAARVRGSATGLRHGFGIPTKRRAGHRVRWHGVALVEARGRADHRRHHPLDPDQHPHLDDGWRLRAHDRRRGDARREARRRAVRRSDRGLLYYALLNGGTKGQTIGKMAMRIQVRDIDTGGPIGVGRGFGRQLMIYLFTFACVLPLLLDYLSPLWDQRRQAWHDKVVRSVVVDVV